MRTKKPFEVDDQADLRRAINAAQLGRKADWHFAMACRRRRLDPDFAIEAPLDALIGTDQPPAAWSET